MGTNADLYVSEIHYFSQKNMDFYFFFKPKPLSMRHNSSKTRIYILCNQTFHHPPPKPDVANKLRVWLFLFVSSL